MQKPTVTLDMPDLLLQPWIEPNETTPYTLKSTHVCSATKVFGSWIVLQPWHGLLQREVQNLKLQCVRLKMHEGKSQSVAQLQTLFFVYTADLVRVMLQIAFGKTSS